MQAPYVPIYVDVGVVPCRECGEATRSENGIRNGSKDAPPAWKMLGRRGTRTEPRCRSEKQRAKVSEIASRPRTHSIERNRRASCHLRFATISTQRTQHVTAHKGD